MTERILKRGERAYKNLELVAAMLEHQSPNGAVYMVEDVYLDFGANWKWTTIVRYGFRECQVLTPREWKDIVIADSLTELAACAEDVRADRYFGDK